VVARAPDEIRVPQGGLTPFEVTVTAEGPIGCGASPSSPATARFDTIHSLVDAQPPAGAQPGDAFPFYANSELVLLPPLGCGVTWNGDPDPYRFPASIAVASNAPTGTYTLDLIARVSNPSGALFAPLEDREPERVTVVVDPAIRGELPNPLENRSINLLPVRGLVRVRYPGTNLSVQLTGPVQVPPQTGVNSEQGYVTLLSDAVGTGVPQSATLWDGSFKVEYTRVLNPERRGKKGRASAPITELAVRGGPGPCGGGQARAAAARRKGLWARGKGRFRTRGRYGAGTVRGTHWFTTETCDGTLFEVRSGVVTVADLTIRRAFAVGPGGSYLAQPPDPRRGASRGRR
jgi:hypothetical protein